MLYPVFEITPDETMSEVLNHKLDLLTIKNTGWIQAKDVEIDISAVFAESKIVKTICLEGDIIRSINWEQTHEVKLDRLSINLECTIGLIQNSNSTFYDVVVTADNAPAQKWFGETQTTKTLSNPQDWISITLAIVGIMAGIITSLIQWNANKKEKRFKQRESEFDPMTSEYCPKCGSNELSRSSEMDPKRDDVYYAILCTKCGWHDHGEL